ncbi:MAG: 4'-phosphopantetheinyl transferase superfamily protein [Alistipes sp.]|nr:4'-phosphopantetheinyl transferase superfamily protein [Alistipes sp.]
MAKLIVEPIPPVYACCDTLITAADVASAARFQNERRRAEHLAWRRIVRRELGRSVAIDYNEVGAPIVDIPNIHISVAHGGGMVAVAIDQRRIGVDIESSERNFEGAKERYMSAEEIALSDIPRWSAMAWTAKEALYKLYGYRGVELRNDIRLTHFDVYGQHIEARFGDGTTALVDITTMEDNIVVAVARLADN